MKHSDMNLTEILNRMTKEGQLRYKLAAQSSLQGKHKSSWYVNERGELVK